MPGMHLIRFPTRKEHKRGLLALLEVPGQFLGRPDYQKVVTEEQVRALEQARVAFEYLSKTAPNGTTGSWSGRT